MLLGEDHPPRVLLPAVTEDITPTKAAATVAEELGTDVRSVKRLAEDCEHAGGVITTKDGPERGSKGDSLLPETQTQIERWIQAKRERGESVFGKDEATWLRSDPRQHDDPTIPARVETRGGKRAVAARREQVSPNTTRTEKPWTSAAGLC